VNQNNAVAALDTSDARAAAAALKKKADCGQSRH
jgi:hypothetical protein